MCSHDCTASAAMHQRAGGTCIFTGSETLTSLKEEIHTKAFGRKKNVILNCVSGGITLTHIGITPDWGPCQVDKLIFFFFPRLGV